MLLSAAALGFRPSSVQCGLPVLSEAGLAGLDIIGHHAGELSSSHIASWQLLACDRLLTLASSLKFGDRERGDGAPSQAYLH